MVVVVDKANTALLPILGMTKVTNSRPNTWKMSFHSSVQKPSEKVTCMKFSAYFD